MGFIFPKNKIRIHAAEKIGIMGTRTGAGVRHLGIAMASYLSSYEKYETAVIDCRRDESLRGIETEELVFGYGIAGFRIKGMDIYQDYEYSMISSGAEKKYDRLIYLLPRDEKGPDIFFGLCDVRYVVGGMRPWEYEDYRLFIKRFSKDHRNISGCTFLSNGLEEEERKLFTREMHCPIIGIPRIKDPFRLCKCDVEFLQTLGSGCIL